MRQHTQRISPSPTGESAKPGSLEPGRIPASLDREAVLPFLPPTATVSRPVGANNGGWARMAYVLTDILFVSFNAFAIFCIRFIPNLPTSVMNWGLEPSNLGLPLKEYVAFLLLYASLVVLFCQSQDLYRTLRWQTPLDECFAVTKAVSFATLLLVAFIYLSGVKTVSRLVVVFSGALNLTTLAAWRLWKRQVTEHRVAQGVGGRNALIVGAGEIGQALAWHIEQNRQLGYVFKGFLDQNQDSNPRMLGKIEDLPQIARAQFVDEVFITIPSERDLVKKIAVEARNLRLNVNVVPELYDGLGWNAPMRYVGEFPVMELHWEPIPALGLFFKRAIDILSSVFALIFLSPVMAVVAAAIKLDSPGPVFYRSTRVGKKGRTFICHKFRSMVTNADDMKDQVRHLNEREGPFFKVTNDPRITQLGKLLRKYSLDELPQFWNVLRGDMSLVGPRPHPLDDYGQYSLGHLRRLDVKPGITCIWQVTARQDPSFETNMALDLEYIESWSLWLDIQILLETIPAVLRGEGA